MMKTVVVTGYTDGKTRTMALANAAVLMAQAGGRVCLTSLARNALDLDLLLWGEDTKKVQTSRGLPGISDLITEYQDTLLTSAWTDVNTLEGDPQTCQYGTLRLRRPSSILQTVEPATEGRKPVHLLRGGRRRLSLDEPKEVDDPRIDWRDFWANSAGAAFFEHIKCDLAAEHDWFFIECDVVEHRELVLLLAAEADIVLLLSDYGDGAQSDAYHLARELRPDTAERPTIMALPAAVRNEEVEMLRRQREHFDEHFRPFAPGDLPRYWFAQAEVPYVPYYMHRHVLIVRQDRSGLYEPLYIAYKYIIDTLQSIAGNLPASVSSASLAEKFADASRRARWDVFISYSSKNQETAVRLREWLRKCELRAFLSSSDLSFEIGTSKWLEAVDSVLERSGVLVLLATEEASSSEWVEHELAEFSKYKRLILPLKFGEHPLPQALTAYQILEWDGSTAEPKVMQKILRVILGGLTLARDRKPLPLNS
jgi:hypothetical protein